MNKIKIKTPDNKMYEFTKQFKEDNTHKIGIILGVICWACLFGYVLWG